MTTLKDATAAYALAALALGMPDHQTPETSRELDWGAISEAKREVQELESYYNRTPNGARIEARAKHAEKATDKRRRANKLARKMRKNK